jgi:hypothetical protein
VVGVSAQQKPTRQPRSGAVGQWAGVVRIVRPLARGRPCQRGSPITGAGLDPSSTPAGIPSNGSDGEGCWGGEAAGTDANVGVDIVRVVAVPEGGAGVVRIVDPRGPAQQLGDPPSSATYAPIRGAWLERNEKSFEAPAAPSRSSQRPASQQPGQSRTAQGQRDQGLKDQEGSLGGRNSRDERHQEG